MIRPIPKCEFINNINKNHSIRNLTNYPPAPGHDTLKKTAEEVIMSHPVNHKSALVVSAHSADFVWRAGGAIALHAQQGYQVHVVWLSFGERG